MSKRIVRWLMAAFVAVLVLVTLTRSSGGKRRKKITTKVASQHPINHIQVDTPWAKLPVRYPVESFDKLTNDPPIAFPRIQYQFSQETEERKQIRETRLKTIRETFEHDWKGYRDHAWMRDELAPLSGGHADVYGGWATTLVDTLDTLWIMGFKEEFDEAVEAVAKIDFGSVPTGGELSLFETTIRYLGGLLSAYDLSGKPILLQKAVELGEMLYVAFDTPNRMPVTRWNWTAALAGEAQEAGQFVLTAEIGSLSLEFTRLAQLTGDNKFFDAIQRITDMFQRQQDYSRLPGMWPISVNGRTAAFAFSNEFSLGAMADSLYEYLPKQFMLLGGRHPEYREMYEKAIDRAEKSLFYRPMTPDNRDILVSGTAVASEEGIELRPDGQHLVCFAGGMIGLGAKLFGRDDLSIARKLTEGCIWAYEIVPKGIMPEVFKLFKCPTPCKWNAALYKAEVKATNPKPKGSTDADMDPVALGLPPGMVKVFDPQYKLRPEAIESVFVMYRITGDVELQEKGWKMFEAIEKATRTDIAHATLKDVLDKTGEKLDKMESFWTAETLKYFYLLYSDPELISLDDYVLNTEAHPFKRPKA